MKVELTLVEAVLTPKHISAKTSGAAGGRRRWRVITSHVHAQNLQNRWGKAPCESRIYGGPAAELIPKSSLSTAASDFAAFSSCKGRRASGLNPSNRCRYCPCATLERARIEDGKEADDVATLSVITNFNPDLTLSTVISHVRLEDQLFIVTVKQSIKGCDTSARYLG